MFVPILPLILASAGFSLLSVETVTALANADYSHQKGEYVLSL